MGFAEVINQDYAKTQIISDLAAKHFPAYLFVGATGIGKRTLALVLAKALCCNNKSLDSCDECSHCRQIERLSYPDVKIIFPIAPQTEEGEIPELTKDYTLEKARPDSPSNGTISIERVRELKYEMGFPPAAGKRRVIIIIDADKMTNEAANSFLKTLEEPQAQTSFILTTERSSALLPTIRSRCQTIRFFGIPAHAITDFLVKKYQISREKAMTAADVAEGSIRRALDYVNNPEQFLAEEIIALFEKKDTNKSNFSELSIKLAEIPVGSIVKSFLFVYRQANLAKLGIKTGFSEKCLSLVDPANKFSLDQINSKIEYLLRTLGDTELYLNKRLFLHSVLANCLSEE